MTRRSPRADGTGPRVFDRLSIRTKLIAMVAAPLAVIVGLAGIGYVQRSSEAAATRADAENIEAIVAAQQLQHDIQLESLYSVAFLAGPEEAPTEELVAQRARVDESTKALDQAMAVVDDGPATQAGASAQRAIGQLPSLREQIDPGTIGWAWAESLYRSVLGALPPLNNRLVAAIDDGGLAQGAGSVVALGDYTTSRARIGILLAGAAADGHFPVVDGGATDPDADTASGVSSRALFVEAVDRSEVQLAVISAQSGSDIRAQLRNRMVGGDLSSFRDTVDRVRALDADALVDVDAARWTPAVVSTLDQLREIGAAEADAVLTEASDRVAASERAARLFLGGALVAVLAALALAVWVATSIARPILRLTSAADRVATEQLPKLVDALRNPNDEDMDHLRPEVGSIEATGGKELAQLAVSVNEIQEVAVNVATEQATMLRKGIGDMFVNLARRNQGLLDRQLEFIDELEAQEDDPDQLEHLFKLDHMATRMRRNAESLLVLAGAEPGRRRGKPVPLTKVALAAVGEIEHFARIDLLDVDECEVVSAAAADLAHLLSELMENATQFSPPDSRVEVVGHGNNGGGYTISITDQGIGMSADQLADANQLLARPPLLGLTLARTLGFIVVGRLANRHGIAVRLVPSPAGGVTAIVSIPSSVLVAQIDTVDLSDGAAPGLGGSPLGGAPAGPTPTSTVATPSSILPPFEFYSGPLEDDLDPVPAPFDDAPATLADAVPTGPAFDEGLSTVAFPAPATPPTPVPASAAPAAPADDVAPEGPVDAGALPARTRGATLAGSGLEPSPFTGSLRGTALDGGALGGDALSGGADPADPAGPGPEGPRLFGAGPRPNGAEAASAGGGTHLFRAPAAPDGPPAEAPDHAHPFEARALPPVPPSSPLVAPGEDLAPIRPPAAPLPPAAPAGGLTARPPATRTTDGPAPVPTLPGPAAPTPGAAPMATPAPAPAPSGDGPELTSAGLVKRVPRRAGAKRAVPGADGPARPATAATTRSPDEVRAMLSRFHSGKQAAALPPAPTPIEEP